MTTSGQATMLDIGELAALRALARGAGADVPTAMRDVLAAKGMVAPDNRLTPAGQHALHVGEAGVVPGIDN